MDPNQKIIAVCERLSESKKLPCETPFHITQTDVWLFSPQIYHHMHGV